MTSKILTIDTDEQLTGAIQVIAGHLEVEPTELKQHGRDAGITLARQVAMYILWGTDERYTLREVGQALGGRTPATVSHGFQRIADQLPSKPILQQQVRKIQRELLARQEV